MNLGCGIGSFLFQAEESLESLFIVLTQLLINQQQLMKQSSGNMVLGDGIMWMTLMIPIGKVYFSN